jgi:RNA polymerase sigma-70 factor (ECF subfamily)
MPGEADLERLLRDGGAGPEEQLLEGEQGKLVHKAVLTLPAHYRIVLVLHDMEDLDTEQVARVLGLQSGTVRVRLHRARLGVRKAMAQLLEGLPEPVVSSGKKRKARRKSVAQARPAECREIFASLSEVLDNQMPEPKCDQMRKHIEACPACVAFLRDLQAAIDRCRNLEVPCDSDMAPRLRSLLVTEYLRLIHQPVG